MRDGLLASLLSSVDRLQMELVSTPPSTEIATILSHLEMAVETIGEGIDSDGKALEPRHEVLLRKYFVQLESVSLRAELTRPAQLAIENLGVAIRQCEKMLSDESSDPEP